MSHPPSPLWISIEPELSETRLSLSVPLVGTALRARLPTQPSQPRALLCLLEAIAAWYGQPICAALDADASDVQRYPERWARLLGDLDGERVRVEWVGHAASPDRRDRFLGAVGDARGGKRLITFAATGLK
jgi:hypothetical protein